MYKRALSSSSSNKSEEEAAAILATAKEREKGQDFLEIINRKITLATEGFTTTTNKFCESILKDRNRLSKENALTVSNYIIAMKREINPRLNTIRTTVQFLSELSRFVGIEKRFEDITREDILLYLDSCRRSENEDPLHKWIGSYNTKRIILFRFFKWSYYPNVSNPEGSMEYLAAGRR
jgi:hypothetical protein